VRQAAKSGPQMFPWLRGEDGAPPARREFYKSMVLETTEEMKVRVYSVEEYRDELGGASEGGFVAALKAYRQLDDEWIDYSPRKAADVLELAPEDYEVDEEHRAFLVRMLPPGMPVSARNELKAREVRDALLVVAHGDFLVVP
jgi:hypothetical protein